MTPASYLASLYWELRCVSCISLYIQYTICALNCFEWSSGLENHYLNTYHIETISFFRDQGFGEGKLDCWVQQVIEKHYKAGLWCKKSVILVQNCTSHSIDPVHLAYLSRNPCRSHVENKTSQRNLCPVRLLDLVPLSSLWLFAYSITDCLGWQTWACCFQLTDATLDDFWKWIETFEKSSWSRPFKTLKTDFASPVLKKDQTRQRSNEPG